MGKPPVPKHEDIGQPEKPEHAPTPITRASTVKIRREQKETHEKTQGKNPGIKPAEPIKNKK
jgi:hypothetical protein